jgi:hypothetical protein
MSEISEGINSLWQLDLVLIQQGSMTRQEQVYGRRRATDPVTGNLSVPDFEVDYEYGFEIVLNKEPALEKVLNNIRMITNKSLPLRLFILHLKTKTMLL